MRRQVLHHLVIDGSQLEEVPRKVGMCLAASTDAQEPLHEGDGRRRADLEVECRHDGDLHLHHILFGICSVCYVGHSVYPWRRHLLKLRRDEVCSDTDELQEPPARGPLLEEAVNERHCEEKRFRLVFGHLVDINEPINQDPPHLRVDVWLVLHIVGLRHVLPLVPAENVENVGLVLSNLLRAIRVVNRYSAALGYYRARGQQRMPCLPFHKRRVRPESLLGHLVAQRL